jgi:transposase-like protein
MPRGVAHPPELRAQAVAAVLAGTALAEVARQFGVSKGTLGNWLAAHNEAPVGTVGTPHARARDPESIAELILDLITTHVTTIQAQLQATTRPDWLEKQSAAELAQLVAVERDTTLRLLAGLRPVAADADDDQRTLAAPDSGDARA